MLPLELNLGLGNLSKVESSVSTTEYTSFDILGRVTGHKQTTDGEQYETEYAYNLSGALIEQTYPSGRKVKNTLDADGNLAQVHSQKSSTDIWRPYASNFVYTAAGAVSSMKLGNGKFENTAFNSRLQPIQIGLGSSATNQGLLKLNYDYGTTNNNSNVLSQTITVPTVGQATGFVATQNYSYDSLNRLKQATENITPNGGSQSLSWQQTYTFDRYGNRNFDEANTTTLPKECTESGNAVVCEAIRPIVNPSVNTGDNRLNGYTFDPAGNTTVDAEGRQFTYDAENKQVKVKDSQNQTIGEYFYNGDGLRIKKVVPDTGETTVFAYDASNKLVAEYSTIVEPPSTAKTSYLTTDHLGSPRITTDQFGQIASRRDFMPFGEEIIRNNYGSDSIRQTFTGYENDGETGLDFAQARYFESGFGRFSTPDPYNIMLEKQYASDGEDGAKLLQDYIHQSQNWNRYVYVWNNPLANIDPDGEKVHVIIYTTGNSRGDDEFRRAAETRAAEIRASKDFDPKKDQVITLGVYSKDQVQGVIDVAKAWEEAGYGKVVALEMFSHSDKDGPTFHNLTTGLGEQWTKDDYQKLNVNWDKEGQAYFHGCYAAAFAQKFADSQGIRSWGYDAYSYFSSEKYKRVPPKSEGAVYLFKSDGYQNGTYRKYLFGNSERYPMIPKDPRPKK